MKPESYIERSGCYNCQLCFTRYSYEESSQYFCTYNAPTRPKCGGAIKEEKFNLSDDKVFMDEIEEWAAWSENRQVQSHGICNEWIELK